MLKMPKEIRIRPKKKVIKKLEIIKKGHKAYEKEDNSYVLKKYKDTKNNLKFKIKKYDDGTTYAYAYTYDKINTINCTEVDNYELMLKRSANGEIFDKDWSTSLSRKIPTRKSLLLKKEQARPNNDMGFKEFVAKYLNPDRSPQEAISTKSTFPAFAEIPQKFKALLSQELQLINEDKELVSFEEPAAEALKNFFQKVGCFILKNILLFCSGSSSRIPLQ